jgi:signal transduction histidine kinase/DNA-binding response OmpR family regulator/ligand-binding sensor domain-containing protein
MAYCPLSMERKHCNKSAERSINKSPMVILNKYGIGIQLIAILFIVHASFGQSQFRFKRFGKTEGLGHEYVWRIAQDSLGFIWANQMFRVSRFDGHSFKTYQYNANDSLTAPLNFLLGRIIKDFGNNLWFVEHKPEIGSQKQTLVKYDRKSDSFKKHQFDLPELKKKHGWVASWSFERDGRSVWLGTSHDALYNYNFVTGEISNYLNIGPDGKPERPYFIATQLDLGPSILLGSGFGLWLFDKESKKFSRPACSPADTALLFSSQIGRILPKVTDKDTIMWLFSPFGKLIKINSRFEVMQTIDVPNGLAIGLSDVDSDGVFWSGGAINSNSGLYRFDTRDGSLVNITHDPTDPLSISTNGVLEVIVDREDNVWIATDKGVNFLGRTDINVYNKTFDDAIGGNMVYKAKNKEYLVLAKHLKDTNDKNQLLISPIIPGRPDSLDFAPFLDPVDAVEIHSLVEGKRHFWIGTLGSGVVGYPIDPNTEMVVPKVAFQLKHLQQNANTISSNAPGYLWEDPEDHLWVLHLTGDLDRVAIGSEYGKEGSVARYGNELGGVFFYPENHGSFWLTRWQNELGLQLFHLPVKTHLAESFRDRIPMKLAPRHMYKAKDGTLLIGTSYGLFTASLKNGKYHLDQSPVINGSEVLAILEDDLGRWWIYGEASLTCYDRSDSTATVFSKIEGFDHLSAIYEGWFHKTSNGTFIVVSPDGISVFDPNSFKRSRKQTNPVLTRLAINNNTLNGQTSPLDPDFVTQSDISVLNELTLDYHHNNLTIEFSSMELNSPEKNIYRHKLEGYDQEWIETDFRARTATYTNLPAGEYTFRVKASNRHGVWSDNERTLKVNILPPPWRTTWAYTGYGILFIGLLYGARKNIVQRERLKSNLKLAKVEQEKEHFELEKAKEVDKVKSTFFANISHEFRTPLTLIKGPVQNLLEQFADHPNVKEQLKLVQRNSDLLLRLINQLLDLAKLESGHLTIEKSENDLNSFLTAVIKSFSSMAIQKSITLEMKLPSVKYLVSFDKDKLETILINLINNAIKFTPAGGSVTVKAAIENHQVSKELGADGTPLRRRGEGLPAAGFAKAGGEVVLTVSDTGIGIPLDQQGKVFERFHQVSEAHKEVGTGIGLSLVKELVALMNGTLSLKSEPGKGSEFSVRLPVEVIRELTEPLEVHDFKEQSTPQQLISKENGHDLEGDTRSRILVVEDNGDLRKFIIDSLGKEFRFLEGADGKQGMETAFEETPDLIISDVMMPEMDGITMTGKLKNDTRTSHIPIILLTAKTSDESKLSGLGTGADDYLTKPFNKNELLLKVRNSIALRVKLREKIKLELLKESPNVEVQSADEKFLLKVREAILARMGDEQLSVESLADEIGLSRSQLFRKISALTGVSVNELIRTFRLQRAAQLLEQKWAPVTQVAYEVGYSNLSYFSKAFKEKYGVSPSEYLAKVQ